MADATPTPEDFERAREDGARISDVDPKRWLEWPVWRIQNLSNCLADALARLEAAERKVEAWKPIVAKATEAAITSAPLAQLTMMCLAVRHLPEDLKP